MRNLFCIVTLLFLSACAKPGSAPPNISHEAIKQETERQLANQFDRHLAGLNRVKSVGHRILLNNHKFCGDKVGPRFGFGAATIDDISQEWRTAAKKKLGISKTLTIVYVAKNSAASRAGMRAGDKIITIGRHKAPTGKGATEKLFERLEKQKTSQKLSFGIERSGKRRSINLKPEFGCNYHIQLTDSTALNAATDGDKIYINRGILRIASTDEELALVIAHELAHITRGHIGKKKQNQVAGMIGGLVVDIALAAVGVNTKGAFTESGSKVGAQAYSKGFEQEADYVGMYFLASAGFKLNNVESFWRKMADEDPKSIRFAGTHPTSPERFLLITKTHKEIRKKRSAGLPLIPSEQIAKAQ